MECSRILSKDAAGSATPCCLHFSSYAWTSPCALQQALARGWQSTGTWLTGGDIDGQSGGQSSLLQGMPPASSVLQAWLRGMPQEWLTADQVAELTSAPVSVMCASKDVASRRTRKWGSRVSRPSRIRSASCRTSQQVVNAIWKHGWAHCADEAAKQRGRGAPVSPKSSGQCHAEHPHKM